MRSNLVPFLERTALFGGLPADDLSACAALFTIVKFTKREVIFSTGDPGRLLYVVAEGSIRLSTSTSDGRELTFRISDVGDMFGEIAALDGGPRTAQAIALSNGFAYALEAGVFRGLWTSRPAVTERVVTFLCGRLRHTSTQAESIALHSIEARVARFLLNAAGDQAVPAGKRVPVDLGYSQGELAQLLGASRPKVNTALSALEKTGAVKRTLDRIFCDPVKLAQIVREHA